jgi:hypothetical protein
MHPNKVQAFETSSLAISRELHGQKSTADSTGKTEKFNENFNISRITDFGFTGLTSLFCEEPG